MRQRERKSQRSGESETEERLGGRQTERPARDRTERGSKTEREIERD